MAIYNLHYVFIGCPSGYTPAASGAPKAYKLLSQKVDFNQAKQTCQDEGSVLAMPRNVDDISDIKTFDCEYFLFSSMQNGTLSIFLLNILRHKI